VIGVDNFASVFGGAPAHTEAHYVEHLRAVIRAGYSPVLCKPGGKETACILSAVQAKREDKAAQQQALAMNPAARVDRIRHACGMKHVIDDPAKVGPIVKRFLEVHGGLNVALHLGRSRMLVVDVDTPTERQAFESTMGLEVGGITVESPGSFDEIKQEWLHWGGGHWWMPLPEDFILPPGKVLKGPGGWAAMYGESYALVPPASRREGPYRLVGGTTPPPSWLLDQITLAGAQRDQHVRDRTAAAAGGPIDQWSADTSWASLLEPQGWIETSMTEGSCGCPIWTAPGDHASPKSATAHDLACARFDVSEGWGPLKIWTDHPPDGLPASGAVTKLQFVAATSYEGSDKQAIRGLGIAPLSAPPAWAVPAEWNEPLQVTINGEQAVISTPDDFGTPGGPPPDPSVPQAPLSSGSGAVEAGTEAEELPSWADVDLTPYLDGTWRPPVPSMLPRSDGLCLIYPGLTHSIHGESESGKSWVAQCEASRLVKLGFHVKYVDFESDAGWVTARMLDLGCTREQISTYFHYSAPTVRPADVLEYGAWSLMFTGRFVLVVIDGVTDALGLWGLKTSDNDDFTAFSRLFPKRLAKETGAGVLMVDHVTKSVEGRGRFALGGQAKMNSLTGAAYVVDIVEPLGIGLRGVLALGLAKDRGGYLRGRAGKMDKSRIQPIGEFVLDGSNPATGLMWALNPPLIPEEEQPDILRDKVRGWLTDYSAQSLRQIIDGVGGRRDDVITTVRRLVDAGEVVIERIGQKHAHTLIAPINIEPGEPTVPTVPPPFLVHGNTTALATVPPFPTPKGGNGNG